MKLSDDDLMVLILEHGHLTRTKGGFWISPDGQHRFHWGAIYRLEGKGLLAFVGPYWRNGTRVMWARVAKKLGAT